MQRHQWQKCLVFTRNLPAFQARYSKFDALMEDAYISTQHQEPVHRFPVLGQQPDQIHNLRICNQSFKQKCNQKPKNSLYF